MSHYAITVSPDEVSQEFKVVLRGPGLGSDGRRYVFATEDRCATFAEAVNFAYKQGLRDGLRSAKTEAERLLLVTGTTPDNMTIRLESWWSRFMRRLSENRA